MHIGSYQRYCYIDYYTFYTILHFQRLSNNRIKRILFPREPVSVKFPSEPPFVKGISIVWNHEEILPNWKAKKLIEQILEVQHFLLLSSNIISIFVNFAHSLMQRKLLSVDTP